MSLLVNDLDRSRKIPGDIGTCLFHKYSGIEMEVVERLDSTEIDEDIDWDPEEQVWLRRTDGKSFEGNYGSPIRRNNDKEELFNEGWLRLTRRDWDAEAN